MIPRLYDVNGEHLSGVDRSDLIFKLPISSMRLMARDIRTSRNIGIGNLRKPLNEPLTILGFRDVTSVDQNIRIVC